MLLSEVKHLEIIQDILDYAKKEDISMQSVEKIIGFGNYSGFFMFYINKDKHLNLQFSSRIHYEKTLKDNLVRYPLTKHYWPNIKQSMDQIVSAYHNKDLENLMLKPLLEEEFQRQDAFDIQHLSQQMTMMMDMLKKLEKRIEFLVERQVTLNKEVKILQNHESRPVLSKPVSNPSNPQRNNRDNPPQYRSHKTPSVIDIRPKLTCVCGHEFLASLGECPICHKTDLEIYRAQNQS